MIQKLIKKEYNEYPVNLKRYLIIHLVKHIDTERLLNATLDLLEDLGFIDDRKLFENHIEETANNGNYSVKQIIKLKALCFSEAMEYTQRMREVGNPAGVPELDLHFKPGSIQSNLDIIQECLKTKFFLKIADEIEALPHPQSENLFKGIITSLANQDYENGTDCFQKEITFMAVRKENIINKSISLDHKSTDNPHPDIFKSKEGFQIFMEFNNNHIIDAYPDYSFIFQQLLNDVLLHKVEHRAFIGWLKKEGLITDKIHAILIDKGFFRSLTKSTTASRMNSYFITKEKYLQNS